MIYLDELDLYIDKITTEQYIKYLNYDEDSSIEDIEKKYLIVHVLANLPMQQVANINLWDINSIYMKLYLYIIENIENKYSWICEKAMGITPIEQQKSIFDDYDKEQDELYGKVEFEKEKTYNQKKIEMINFFIRYMSTNHKLNYNDFMKSDLSELLDNIFYNLKYDREHKTE